MVSYNHANVKGMQAMARPTTTEAMNDYAARDDVPRWFAEALERFVAAGTITREQADAACPRRPAA